MKAAPTFGAVPSTADLEKKREEAASEEDKREALLEAMLAKEALERLNKVELINPRKAERVKAELFSMAGSYSKEKPVSDEKLLELLANADKAADVVVTNRGLVLDRRRVGDDDDSDIDLDGL